MLASTSSDSPEVIERPLSPPPIDSEDEVKLPKPSRRHPHYYINEQMTIFLVEDELFRIHRQFLRKESVIFDSMFDCPPPVEGYEGQCDDNPIILPDVTPNEFEALMDYFYEGTFFLRRKESIPKTLQQNIDLLSIATRFECTGARSRAIIDIEPSLSDPVEKIVLANKFQVDHWLTPAYVDLCTRDKPLELEEGRRIGFERAMAIAAARENIRYSVESQAIIDTKIQTVYRGVVTARVPWPAKEALMEESRVKRLIHQALSSGQTVTVVSAPVHRPSLLSKKAKLKMKMKARRKREGSLTFNDSE